MAEEKKEFQEELEEAEKKAEAVKVEGGEDAPDSQGNKGEAPNASEASFDGQEESPQEISEDGQEVSAEEPEEKAGDKKIFGRKKDKKTEKLEAENAELKDQLVRRLAEFENFRKRSEKEKSQMFEVGAKTVIEKLLPVIDNFERGLMGIPEEEKDAPFVQGVELVYKQLLTAFEELGVTAIEAEGAEFDPNLHNAVMMVDDEEKGSGTVAEVMQKGYLYHDSVVRHSMVKVVN